MEIVEVKRQIKDGRLSPFYVFTGEEVEAQKIYVNKISEVAKKPLQYVDSVAQALNKRGGLLKQSHCYVCRDDAEFIKAEAAWENVSDLLGDNILILELTKIDGRSKFYKRFKADIVTFNHMEHDVLAKYTRKALGGNADTDAVEELIDVCEGDYGRVLMEADKAVRHADLHGTSASDAVRALIAEGVICRPPRDAIFDLCDSILAYDVLGAYDNYENCSRYGESSLAILKVLYKNVRKVLQIQSANGGDLEKVTGLTAWEIKCARKFEGVWDSAKLVYMLRLIQKIEQGIKQGFIDENVAIPYMLSHIF